LLAEYIVADCGVFLREVDVSW